MSEQSVSDTGAFSPVRRFTRSRIAWVLSLFWGFCACWYLAPPSKDIIERFYTRGFYRFISYWVTLVTGAFPFSVFFTFAAVILPTFIVFWAWQWYYRRHKKGAKPLPRVYLGAQVVHHLPFARFAMVPSFLGYGIPASYH